MGRPTLCGMNPSARDRERGTLLLVPTELERRRLLDAGGFEGVGKELQLCGFGPIAAAARTASLIEREQPGRVLLIGIAGSFDGTQLAVGTATEFRTVAIDGIGAGEGAELKGPSALGFPQWPGGMEGPEHPIVEQLALDTPSDCKASGSLLTTCAASATAAQCEERRKRFPDVKAEDMEGFACALACRLAGIPIRIVRGISNLVGERDPKQWHIPQALNAAHRLTLEILESDEPWTE